MNKQHDWIGGALGTNENPLKGVVDGNLLALGRVLDGSSEIAKFVEEATRASSDFRFEEVSLFSADTITRMSGS